MSRELQPYQKRVVDEFEELDGRIKKLVAFINDRKRFQDVDEAEQFLLKHQLLGMSTYAYCLKARIERWVTAS